MKDLKTKLAAGYPAIALVTPEEARAEFDLAQSCKELEKDVFVWTLTGGLRSSEGETFEGTDSPFGVLGKIEAMLKGDQVFVLKDFHHHLDDATVVRKIRDIIPSLKNAGAHLLFLGPEFNPPSDLQREVVKVDFDLPDRKELEEVLKGICEKNEVKVGDNGFKDKMIESGLGLTSIEYENALAEALVECEGELDPKIVSKIKSKIVASGGLLEVAKTEDLPDVGGNKNLIEWLLKRKGTFSKKAREYGLRAPKGIMLVGRPGCGKSLAGKQASKYLDVPFVWYLDMGKLMDKYVGESEKHLREVLKAAEASAPCALLIDEVDKTGPKDGSAEQTNGVDQKLLGTLLTWMQDRPKDKMIFVIFTANTLSGIPAPLLRKGRTDEIFLVDLPDVYERREIIEIHLKLRKRDPKNFKVEALAEASPDFTGAEIEAGIEEAMVQAFADNGREVNYADVLEQFKQTSPQARLMPEVAKEFEDWISKKKAKPASKREATDQVYQMGARKVKT